MSEPMSEEESQQWYDIITRAARFVVSDFPDIEFEDITQEFWVELLGKGTRPDVTRPGVTKIVQRRLKKYAWDIRKEQLERSAQYSYRTSDVRVILETMFFKEEWYGGFVPEDAKSLSPPNMTDAIDLRADVTWAFSTLPEAYRAAITARYLHQREPEVQSKERRQLNRAIQRLTDRLNHHYRGVTRRYAMSNAAARALLEGQESD